MADRSPTHLRVATVEDVPAVVDVMSAVSAALDDASVFEADDADFIRRHIADDGFIVVAEDDQRIVGFCLVRFPRAEPDNLGWDVNLAPDAAARVAHIESVAVHPRSRGRGLQRALVTECERRLAAEGTTTALCTVAPANTVSLGNFTALGYRVVVTKEKYGGKVRHVLMKELVT